MTRSHHVRVLCFAAVLAVASPAGAQGPAPDLIVEGTKTGTPIEQMTGAVTIIDEATIQALRVPTVGEVLRQVEGLDVVQLGGPGGQTSLFLRGGNSNHVLVLIDGVKVNSPTTGAFDPAHLTVDQIERIEVLRGSQSPLYGSEALAGVVNIITKRGHEGAKDQLTIEGGTYRTWRGVLNHSDRGPIWDESLSISRWTSQGISRASERRGNTEPDGYANTTFSTKLGRGAGVGGRMELTARLTDATTDIDDGSGPAPTYLIADSPAKSRDKSAVLGASVSTPITPSWDQRLAVGWSRDHGTTTEGSFGNSDIDAQSRQLEWRHTLLAGPDNMVTAGYEYQQRSGRYNADYDETIVTNSLYLHDQLAALDPLMVTAGARSDGNNRFGRHNTYQVGSSLMIRASQTRVFSNYSTGFRGPTLNDLFSPWGSNPNLKPETSHGYEAGLTQALGPLTVGGTYFHARYKNLIVPDPTAPLFVYFPINLDTAFARGVEGSVEVRASKARIQGTYTYTATRDGATNDQLLRRPRNKAGVVLAFQPEKDADLRLDYRYVGEREDYGGGTLPAYSLVNLSASRAWTPGVTGFVRVENLFDRVYEEVTGYGTAGRSLYAGLTASF